MSEYFSIEKQDIIEQDIETEIKEKYYTIRIEGLPYGSLIRETTNYSEALDMYREIKNEFNFFNCRVILEKHIIKENNCEETICIYSKKIGEDFEIEKHLNDIITTLDKLDKMKRMYLMTNSECDKYISAFQHSLEHINAEKLSETQMRSLFRNVEEKGALRRISKSQIDHLTTLSGNLSQIRSNVRKALEAYKKVEYNRNSQKAIENRMIKDKEYLTTIGLI